MRLYYMTTLETLEAHILPSNRIKVSTFDKVNDPFELLCVRLADKGRRRQYRMLYEHWVKRLGFISFGEKWSSPLMWGYYAADHTGVCLGVEVPDDRVIKVQYEQERMRDLLTDSPLDDAVDDGLIQQVVTTKFKEWEYEREWRYMVNLEHPEEGTGFHFVEFSPEFELRQIIAGARCARSLDDIRKQIFGNTGEIELTQARAAFGRFEMVRQLQQPRLTVSPLHRVAGLGKRPNVRRWA